MSTPLTLWEIEKGIAELFDALDQADSPETRGACETALAEYFAREVSKVDGIRALYKQFDLLAWAARQEMRDLQQRALTFERRRDKIKELAQIVMEAHGLTRLEGRTGRLLIKGNGGLQPLEITDATAVPDECCKYTGWVRADLWRAMLELYQGLADRSGHYSMERIVDNELTRNAIDREGGMPGARLADRGRHLEVR